MAYVTHTLSLAIISEVLQKDINQYNNISNTKAIQTQWQYISGMGGRNAVLSHKNRTVGNYERNHNHHQSYNLRSVTHCKNEYASYKSVGPS